MNTDPSKEAKDIEVVFDEWRELFNRYRNQTSLKLADRKRFTMLSRKLRDAGFFKRMPSDARQG